MAETMTKFANRYGLDVQVFAYTDGAVGDAALMTIDFANSCALDVNGERVWATGGQDHANMVGFNNPIQGTLTISTQIMTKELLALIAGYDEFTDVDSITFSNDAKSSPKFFTLKAATVWQDTTAKSHSEVLTFHKVSPQMAYNITYTGDGDPASVDIVFDVLQDKDGKVITVSKVNDEGITGSIPAVS